MISCSYTDSKYTDPQFDTSPEIFELALTNACRESRYVYLKAFPRALPLQRRGNVGYGIATFWFDDATIIYIQNFEEFFFENIVSSLRTIPFPSWSKGIKSLAISGRCIIDLDYCRSLNKRAIALYFNNLVSISVVGGKWELIHGRHRENISEVYLPGMKEDFHAAIQELGPPGSSLPTMDYFQYYIPPSK